jgi:hypothetical protein
LARTRQSTTAAGAATKGAATFDYPSPLADNTCALRGRWTLDQQTSTAEDDNVITLSYHAHNLYLVVGGTGTRTVTRNGATTRIPVWATQHAPNRLRRYCRRRACRGRTVPGSACRRCQLPVTPLCAGASIPIPPGRMSGLRPLRNYFYWEEHCFDVPVWAALRSIFDTLDGIDALSDRFGKVTASLDKLNALQPQLMALLPAQVAIQQTNGP